MKIKYIIEHYEKKETWKSARGFGGSSVSALFGNNPYMNKLDIYCSAMNPTEEKKDKDTASTIYGRNAEKLICDFFAIHNKEYDVEYPSDITMYRRVDKPYMTYTADALLKDLKTQKKGILEIKTHLVLSKADVDEWRSGKLPKRYVNQVLQGFAVKNDVSFVILVVELIFIDYDTGKWQSSEIRSFRLERKDCIKEIKAVEKAQTDFQENHIDKRLPPDLEIEIDLGELL